LSDPTAATGLPSTDQLFTASGLYTVRLVRLIPLGAVLSSETVTVADTSPEVRSNVAS